jgi:hypothetical protein
MLNESKSARLIAQIPSEERTADTNSVNRAVNRRTSASSIPKKLAKRSRGSRGPPDSKSTV